MATIDPTPQDSDPIEDPDVQARLANLKPMSYPVNYAFLNLLKDRMEETGSPYMIAIPRFPVDCESCHAKVVPAGHHRALFPCSQGCGWHVAQRDAA